MPNIDQIKELCGNYSILKKEVLKARKEFASASKQLKASLAQPLSEMSEIEDSIIQYMKENDLPKFQCKDILFSLDESKKKIKFNESDLIDFLKSREIDDYEEIARLCFEPKSIEKETKLKAKLKQ